jgi:hypothetical protein
MGEPKGKWSTLYKFAEGIFWQKTTRDAQEEIEEVVNIAQSTVEQMKFEMVSNPNKTFTFPSLTFGQLNETVITNNTTNTEVEIGPNSIKISSPEAYQVLIIIGIVALLIIIGLVYRCSVQKAKAKARHNQSITFSPTINHKVYFNILGGENGVPIVQIPGASNASDSRYPGKVTHISADKIN